MFGARGTIVPRFTKMGICSTPPVAVIVAGPVVVAPVQTLIQVPGGIHAERLVPVCAIGATRIPLPSRY